jgi:hypothetical protein
MKRAKKSLLSFLPLRNQQASSAYDGFDTRFTWTTAQVVTPLERKARAAIEYLGFGRSLHKLKPFISL